MTQPIRIRRRRTKGWRMPEGAVYVGRPSRFGNPWKVGLRPCGCREAGCLCNAGRAATPQAAVDYFRYFYGMDADSPSNFGSATAAHALRERARNELRGKDLCCWCPLDQPCHADVLLEIANS